MYKIVLKMNTLIFGKGRSKILECFYKNKNKEIYFSEILRQTGLTQNTTLMHLKLLEENNLILSIRKIGNTFYRINTKNPQIYSILSYFDYKRLNELPFSRRKAIIDFLEKIKSKPLIALVFGSTAKGTFESKSDIDIYLIYNKREAKDNKLINEVEALTGTKIQTFISSYENFKEQILKQEDKVLIHAIKTGFIVSGFDIFYKEVLQ